MRRGNFQAGTVDYAAVGATQAPDLMGYPPHGTVPAEASWRIGSGDARFRSAADQLLSWGAQRGAGLTVSDVRPASGPMYSGVGFDAEGTPVQASRLDQEQRFDADGTPYVSPGATVHLRGRVGGMRADAELRVISVTDEPRRVGFSLGTVEGSVVSGEESFLVEWRDDDEVWLIVRAFDRRVGFLYRLWRPLVRRRRRELFHGYHRAISPLYATGA
ncbi:uncharacterized protein (UPF0548 family) [Microbacterium marinum]|uniref:Uncharacterized protein (UPF0548 family) n=1 Tax=Microbacterium marinum TaxID=421115 RepID=A0A7W7BRE0_9MICO|nr:DUF1990 family protein [Microbacterium marinum]MBB4667453.1 uncharacterized protein (UPF0548 family) [Microbacterium marinum]